MIRSSKRFYEYFRGIYEASTGDLQSSKSFEEVFKDNESRLEFILKLFEAFDKNKLSIQSRRIFEDTIDYVVAFMNGDRKGRDVKIPAEYYEDESLGAIIPSMEDVEFLLRLIQMNRNVFEMYYKDNLLALTLPDNTFNQNMQRCLEIKEKNLAHLLGLTEHEDPNKPDPNRNLLKKFILSKIANRSDYGYTDSEIVLNWITSEEGQAELLELHKKTLDFVAEDRKKFPNAYDSNGNLKPNSATVDKFKQRYKAATGYDYPIINFSRFIAKSANTLNFLNLNNVVEMILDYNAPEGKTNEKDIFLVIGPARKFLTRNNMYMDARSEILVAFYEYAFDPNNEDARQLLVAAGIDLRNEKIIDQLNIIKARDFIEYYGINPDDSIIDEQIVSGIGSCFEREVHMLGFKTEFNGEKEIPLEDMRIHGAHCDTSISLTIPELVGHYYKRGRPFFLDKVESLRAEFGRDECYLLISNVRDEINYLERVIDLKADAEERIKKLKKLREVLNGEYEMYKERKERQR